MSSRHPLLYVLSGYLLLAATQTAAADALWRDAPQARNGSGARSADPDLPTRYRSVILDRPTLDGTMGRARRAASPPTLELPLPDGGSTRFQLEHSDVLPPGLASRYPSLASMKGQDADGRRVRLDIARDGVHATVRDPSGDWSVRPQAAATARSRSARASHLVFRLADAKASPRRDMDDVMEPGQTAGPAPTARVGGTGAGGLLRTFRIAMSATSVYTRHMGGTVEDGLAGVVRTVNRVNEIFENDFGVHFVLAEDNDRLIFTHPEDDPFAGADTPLETALRNVDTTERVLGSKAFDVGHVLDAQADAGIVGRIGNTCLNWSGEADGRAASKAAGTSGHTRPFGDVFHAHFVAHELGHQFGARHTFNGCGIYRDASSARAPGSGSTIMSYVGIGTCGTHDLQEQNDPYFHAGSIEQVQRWLSSAGGSCAATRINTSPAPWIDIESLHRPVVVPARTPFRLGAEALFADPAAKLTYTFEQMDVGLIGQSLDSGLKDTGEGPLFRSRSPNAEGIQTFPAMSVLLGDEPYGLGDALPTNNRNLRFRLTVRDGLDQRSHVVSADRDVRVVDTGGAFEIVAPRAAAVLRRGKPRLVRWNVAGTAKPPISCETISIDLSLDGGRTFDIALAEVPNNGRAMVDVPKNIAPTRRGRLSASCVDGAFFALSPGEFDIR